MPSFPLIDALKPARWRDHFGKRTLARANDYLHRVSNIARLDDGDTVTLEAQVKGSASTPYQASVTIEYIDEGVYSYTSECSCPVGWDCKHVAALLMMASQHFEPATGPSVPRKRPAPVPEWKAWVGALAHPAPTLPALPAARIEEEKRQIAVVFDVIDTRIPAQLVAKLVWVQKTRQGRWGKLAPIRLDGLGNDLDAGQLQGPWHDRLARLQLRPSVWHARHQNAHLLKGPNAETLLDELLHAGVPCFWQKPTGGDVRPGPDRSAQWHWRTNEDGVQRLQLEGGLLLQVDGYWLLDPHTLILQRLAGSDDATMIDALLRMPPIPPEESTNFAEYARTHPALSALPQPQVIHVAAPIEAVPTPVLTLLQIPLKPGGWARDPHKHLPCVRLEFDYDGHRLPGPPSTEDLRRIHSGTLQWVRRSRSHEDAAQAMLTGADLYPIHIHYGLHYRIADAHKMHDYVAGRLGNPVYDPAALLQKVVALSQHGFRIETDSSFPLTLGGTPDDWYATIDDSASGLAWFDVELGIELDGERISLLPILQRALEQRSLNLSSAPPDEAPDAVWHVVLPDGRVIALPLARLRALAAPLLQWLNGGEQTLRVPRVAAAILDDLSDAAQLQLRGKTAAGLRNLAAQLRQSRERRPVAVPRTLKASLRPYQRDGLTWLDALARTGLGGVLADDMGLGKTVQILGHLLKEREAGQLDLPALVVCPTSVVGNWQEQAARFAPVLRVRVIHGSARHDEYDALDTCDLAITTYALLPRDRDVLLKQRFSLAIFDEAQALKNANSQAAQVARALPARRKIAVTGTPLENHLGELWSQFECVLPGLLGDSKSFTKHFRTPIEKHNDEARQRLLNRRTAPFMLRRTKGQVAQELPAKTEIVQTLELSGKQRELYETLRLSMHQKVMDTVKKRGLSQSSIIILDALLKLRQACCDPRLIKIDAARKIKDSAKLDALLSMLDSLLSEGRRILLFSQFTGMLDLIEVALRERDIAWLRLDGSSRNRAQLVERFQSGEAPLFLISLKAGGVGLNLTAADTVIHYDPWWNPAIEAQATDRAHRIGQTQPVFVYKLICSGTVEEKIQTLQQRKGDLARAVLEGGTRTSLTFDETDIEALFAPI
jgi:superfamily II DNA or RNA helicase